MWRNTHFELNSAAMIARRQAFVLPPPWIYTNMQRGSSPMYRQMSFHTHVFLINFFVLFQIKPPLPPSVNNFGELRFSHAAFCLSAAVLIFLRPREMKKFLCDETYNILLSIGAVPQRWALRRFENMPHSMSNQCPHVAYGQ